MEKNKLADFPKPPDNRDGWPWQEKFDPFPENMPDGSNWPKISIVTPSLNQADYLEETIRSVLLQGYPNLEYIIIDGGSTDSSVEIIKKYEPWLEYWESKPDRGQSHAINKGFEKCTGEIINWLNSDDYLLPGALFRLAVHSAQKTSDVFVMLGNALVLKEDGTLINRKSISLSSGWTKKIGVVYDGGAQASWFFSRKLLTLLGPVNESYHYSMDIDYSIRWTAFNPEYILIKESLAVFREHQAAKTRHFVVSSMNERMGLYTQVVSNMQVSEIEKKYLMDQIKKNISGYYLSRIGHPINIKYLYHSIVLYPSRVLTRDFWKTVLGL